MPFVTSHIRYPEIVFGIAGPIGIDIEAIIRTLQDTLTAVGYSSGVVRVTDAIKNLKSSAERPSVSSFYNETRYKMLHASALCREIGDPAFLMRVALTKIREERQRLLTLPEGPVNADDAEESVISTIVPTDEVPFFQFDNADDAALRSAFIIRQIKRPEEVNFLRYVYGAQFVLISGYGTEPDRQRILRDKIKYSEIADVKEAREIYLANKLMELDASEDQDSFGQHLRDAFHLADVVIDGISRTQMRSDIERFINALFGLNEVAPTRAEYGMFSAYSAALRSSDLSRQVGAALFTNEGELVASGCNEVPKAFGGTYWDGESPDNRDIKLGKDSNDILKIDVLKDLITRMKKNGLLSDKVIKAGSPSRIVNFLIGREKGPNEFDALKGALKNAKILDLTEYGRVVHAEMNTILEAARLGHAVNRTTLFTTTFPCHNCTKHVIASGIREVVFLEPYPKSKAKELHENEVEIEGEAREKVVFRYFSGITPARYEDVFRKSKRKKDGAAVRWQHGGPAPMMYVKTPSYMQLEELLKWSEGDEEEAEVSDSK